MTNLVGSKTPLPLPRLQTLLCSLAERGFEQLYEEVRGAMNQIGQPRAERLNAAALAFVTFARERAHLLELMFSKTRDDSSGRLSELAARQFGLIGELIPDQDHADPTEIETRRLAFVTMIPPRASPPSPRPTASPTRKSSP